MIVTKSSLDQFYTNETVARDCFEKLKTMFDLDTFDVFVEPCAGTGSFSKLFPESKTLAIDIDPKTDGIIKADFLSYTVAAESGKRIITISNPPFGKNSNLAIKFFNKAAEFSDIIAFIVPRTFRKRWAHDQLDLNFHLDFDCDIPQNSFVLHGNAYDVPCCFQVWNKKGVCREKLKKVFTNDYFDFVKAVDADFTIRRVGGRAGFASRIVSGLAEPSHYFLKYKGAMNIDEFISLINTIDFLNVSGETAGVKSISKPELLEKINSSLMNL